MGRMRMAVASMSTLARQIGIASSLTVGCMLLSLTEAQAEAVHTFNFSGTGADDMGTYKLARYWWFKRTQDTIAGYSFGVAGDAPIPADYDGDGKTDFAMYRPSTASLRWVRSSDGVFGSETMGDFNDVPIVADFDGDGKTDRCIFHPRAAQYWYYRSSDNTLARIDAGKPGDLPVIGDFDADGRDEGAVFNPITATFSYWPSAGGAQVNLQLGVAGDTPLVGDYDGDGKADPTVYHSQTSTYTYRRSSDGAVVTQQLGQHGDIPITGDFDGDGKTDLTVFHPQAGWYNTFYYRSSITQQIVSQDFGDPYDVPLGMRYQPTGLPPSRSYVALPDAPQLIYQQGVPQMSRDGAISLSAGATPFLPRCIYETNRSMFPAPPNQNTSILHNAGFNCFKPWNGDSLTNVLQDAENHDMQVIKQMVVFSGLQCTASSPCPSAATQINSHINEIVSAQNALGFHLPRLLAWDVDDEPTGYCSEIAQDCEIRRNNITNLVTQMWYRDSAHPFFLIDVAPSGFDPTKYFTYFDQWTQFNTHPHTSFVSIDPYPFKSGSEATLAGFAGDYVLAAHLRNHTKPLWAVLQTFSSRTESFTRTMPTAQQIRAQAFTALVHGATGILYFAVDSPQIRNAGVVGIAPSIPESYFPNDPNNEDLKSTQQEREGAPALWASVVALNKELQSLQNVILSPTSTLSYSVDSAGSAVSSVPLRTMLKQSANGVYTLLVVNIDNVALDFRINLPSTPVEPFRIEPNGARYPKGVYGGQLMDSIEGFGVRKYEFK